MNLIDLNKALPNPSLVDTLDLGHLEQDMQELLHKQKLDRESLGEQLHEARELVKREIIQLWTPAQILSACEPEHYENERSPTATKTQTRRFENGRDQARDANTGDI